MKGAPHPDPETRCPAYLPGIFFVDHPFGLVCPGKKRHIHSCGSYSYLSASMGFRREALYAG